MAFEAVKRLFTGSSAPIEQKSGIATPDQWLIELFGALPAASGVSVTPANAMRCTAVRAAVNAISEAIGQLPVHVYHRTADDGKERASDHPSYTLINAEANPWTTSADLREQLTRDALLYGSGYAEIIRVGEGRAYELHRLDPASISVEFADDGSPIYRQSMAKGGSRVLMWRNVLHISASNGASPVTDAKEAIALALVLEAHGARLFGNGGRPSGILSTKEPLTAQAITNALAVWNAAHRGENSGKTALLDNGIDFTPLAFTSVDAQFLELRKFAIQEIARAFRVPLVFLFDYDRATWSNSEEMGRQFLTYTLMPWIKRWEGEFRLKLFSPDERKSYFAEFLIDDLLRADLEKRAEAYSKLVAARVLNPNECRAMENRPPYVGGDVFVNPNTTPGNTNV